MKFVFLTLFVSAILTTVLLAMLSSALLSEIKIFMDKKRRVCRVPVVRD